jgi:multicomponent Na+:H+ antiporter subunit C
VNLASHYAYGVTIFLMIAGLYIVIARGNLVKKLIGLGVFQTSVYLLYIAPGKLIGGTAPIIAPEFTVYSLALGLAIVVRIREAYDSIEEDEILAADEAEDAQRRS